MGIYGFAILCILALLSSFYCGIVLGIRDTKRSYGIARGVTPEEYNHLLEEVYEMAYANWKEVEEDGCFYP